MKKAVVLALGGNALTLPGQAGTYDEMQANAVAMAGCLGELLTAGYGVVVVHGNGPQVGNIAIQQEEAADRVPAQPLFVVGSMTQGEIGSLLCLAVRNALGRRVAPVAVVTHVLVDPDDEAFAHPSKPIGPFFSPRQAKRLAGDRGWSLIDDAGRGLRRSVPSPQPHGILELDVIRELIAGGSLVIAAGGGGIPVTIRGGRVSGIDAVIDKDLAAQRLATDLGAEILAMVTGVSQVAVDFGTPAERGIEEMTMREAQELQAQDQFPPGSMGPKVEAAVRFLEGGGRLSVITSPEHVLAAVQGKHGTRIVPTPVAAHAR